MRQGCAAAGCRAGMHLLHQGAGGAGVDCAGGACRARIGAKPGSLMHPAHESDQNRSVRPWSGPVAGRLSHRVHGRGRERRLPVNCRLGRH